MFFSIIQRRNRNGNNQNIKVAKQIQFEELDSVLTQLLNGRLEHDFFGITSDGIDCIYLVKNHYKFQIEFEAMTENKIPFIEKLKTFLLNHLQYFKNKRQFLIFIWVHVVNPLYLMEIRINKSLVQLRYIRNDQRRSCVKLYANSNP